MKTKGKICPIMSFRSEKSSYIIQTCDEECAWFNEETQCCAILEKFSLPISQDYSLIPTNVMKLKEENETLKEVIAKYQEENERQQQFLTSASQDLWEELGWQH